MDIFIPSIFPEVLDDPSLSEATQEIIDCRSGIGTRGETLTRLKEEFSHILTKVQCL